MAGNDASTQNIRYPWEREVERTWEHVKEVPGVGLVVEEAMGLRKDTSAEWRDAKKKAHAEGMEHARHGEMGHVQKGTQRNVFVCVDASEWSLDRNTATHLSPNPLDFQIRLVKDFVEKYFDQNPLSSLGLIAAHEGVSYLITDLSGEPKRHCHALSAHLDPSKRHPYTSHLYGVGTLHQPEGRPGTGDYSLLNVMERARFGLRCVPPHETKEVIVVSVSMFTSDHGDIEHLIHLLAKEGIRCSVLSLVSDMRIMQYLCKETKGKCMVALDERHAFSCMSEFVHPPPLFSSAPLHAVLRPIGFARSIGGKLVVCACHGQLRRGGYECPRCKSMMCEIPSYCAVCTIQLASAAHVSRLVHHLFPVPLFERIQEEGDCRACTKPLLFKEDVSTWPGRCGRCQSVFCHLCDAYIHEELFHCPGCGK